MCIKKSPGHNWQGDYIIMVEILSHNITHNHCAEPIVLIRYNSSNMLDLMC